MHHIFLMHSSVSGCLGRFHVLAVINSAAVTVGVHASVVVFYIYFIYLFRLFYLFI